MAKGGEEIPGTKRCLELLDAEGVPEHIRRHSERVAEVALRLVALLNANGEKLDALAWYLALNLSWGKLVEWHSFKSLVVQAKNMAFNPVFISVSAGILSMVFTILK